MEKKVMYIIIGVIAILLVAGLGAALLLSNNSSNSTPNIKILTISANTSSTATRMHYRLTPGQRSRFMKIQNANLHIIFFYCGSGKRRKAGVIR